MITFHHIEYKNILSTGNIPNKIELNIHNTTLILGKNGHGKCLDKFTSIDISIEDEEISKLFEKFIVLV